MYRRLYFLFPDVVHATRVVSELEQAGIERQRMHAIAREDMDISALPIASPQQKHDLGKQIEIVLWDSNLIIFFIALAALVATLIWVSPVWALLPVAIMAVTFISGALFTMTVPNVHLNEFSDAIHHGEILLMVDVARHRVNEIEDRVHRKHPEAAVGGVGWTTSMLPI